MNYHLQFTFFLPLLTAEPFPPLLFLACPAQKAPPLPRLPCTPLHSAVPFQRWSNPTFKQYLRHSHYTRFIFIVLQSLLNNSEYFITLSHSWCCWGWSTVILRWVRPIESPLLFLVMLFPMCMSVLASTGISVPFSCPVTHRYEIYLGTSYSATESPWHHFMLSHITSTSFSTEHWAMQGFLLC